MHTTTINKTQKVSARNSPFKFLAPYQTKDSAIFFGRAEEIRMLKSVFRKSSFVVLYGPSGSGKSSLINCGLLNNIPSDLVFQIRRNHNIIDSINLSLFEGTNFSDQLSELNSLKSSHSNLEQKIDALNDDLIKYESDYQKGNLEGDKYEELTTKLEQEIYEVDVRIPSVKANITTLEKELVGILGKLCRRLRKTPYLIFDQFEELFISGSKTELTEFGTFLSIIFSNNIPFKILLSLREEYFVKLSRFEQFLPQILHKRAELNNPDKDSVKKIIDNSFRIFNINQQYDKDQSTIQKEEQDARRDLIIEQLSVKGEGFSEFTHGNKEYYLPFLQIYLDELYRKDFKKTYGNTKVYEVSEESEYPPLEFERQEIKSFGNLYDVLMEYIKLVNGDIVKNSTLRLGRAKRRQNYAVKFLRHFVTLENTKERISVTSNSQESEDKEEVIKIADDSIRKKIKLSVWGNKKDINYEAEISHILNKLRTYRLIKINDGMAELSHDLLAKVINKFAIQKSLEELLKIRFDTYFEVYKKQGEQDKNLISETEIMAFSDEKTLPFVLYDNDEEIKKEKEAYWALSLSTAQEKIHEKEIAQKAEIQRLRTKNIIIGILAGISLIALIFSINYSYELEKSNTKLTESRKQTEVEKKKQENLSMVQEGAGNAFKELKTDRTNTYKEIEKSNGNFDKFLVNSGIKKPSFIGDFKNDLYRDFNQYPFYSKELALEGMDKSPIIETKHLLSPTNSDSVYIYFLTEKKDLFVAIPNYTKAEEPFNYKMIARNINAFEAFSTKQKQIELLIIRQDSIFRFEQHAQKFHPIRKGKNEYFKNAKTLLRLKTNQFIFNTNRRVYGFSFDKEFALNSPKYLTSIKNQNIKELQKFGQDSSYLILTTFGDIFYPEKDQFHFKGNDLIRNRVGAKTVKTLGGDQLFIGTNEKIFLSEFGIHNEERGENNYVRHNHDDRITSINYFQFGRKKWWIIAGSEDRTASIWSWDSKNNKDEKRRLIGHSDKISFVTFLDRQSDQYALTASADGTIKIWDLRPLEKQSINIREANAIRKLKINPKDSLLYVGFMFTSLNTPRGYLSTTCQDIENFNCRDSVKQRIGRSETLGNITSFDFAKDSLIMLGGYWNQLIASNKKYPKSFRLPNIYNIHDIRIKSDTLLAVASGNGLSYFSNFLKHPKRKRDLFLKDAIKTSFNSVDIHPTKNWILGAADDGNVYLWDTEKNTKDTLVGHLDKVMDATFSASGRFIVSGSWDNKAIIWEWNNGKYEKFGNAIRAHTNDIVDVEFFKDEMILTASSDNTVQLLKWNEEEQNFVRIPSLIRHDTKVSAATFSLDGNYIFSGDIKGNVKKWAIKEFKQDLEARIHGL